MKRKIVAGLVCVLVTLTMIGGCGNKNQDAANTNVAAGSDDSLQENGLSENTSESEGSIKSAPLHGAEDESGQTSESQSDQEAGNGAEQSAGNDANQSAAKNPDQSSGDSKEVEAGKESATASQNGSDGTAGSGKDAGLDYEELYEPVFSEILDVINNGFDYDIEYQYASDGLFEKIMYPGDSDLMEDIGYVLDDMSGDGIPELVIGTDEDYEGDGDESYIYSVFTLKDNQPFRVFGGSARSSYRWMHNGHFCYWGSGGAMITLMGENHLSKDGQEIIWDDFYFTDEKNGGEIGIYHNTSGIFDAEVSEELNITDEQFSKIMDGYIGRCTLLSWTPIGTEASASAKGATDSTADTSDSTGTTNAYSSMDPGDVYADISYESNTITINGKTYNMSDYVAMCNAVMGYTQVGSWIIVEGHINPHVGVYEFYNLYSGKFEYEILGANLTMWENDISTAVYSNWNSIYDLYGNMIAWPSGEVYSLEYKDDHTLVADVMPDSNPSGDMVKEEYEYYNYDHAMFDYYSALVSDNDYEWQKFYNLAPASAYAFVIENPPERFLENEKFYGIVNKQGGMWSDGATATDKLVAVPLYDDTLISIESYDTDSAGMALYSSPDYLAGRGESVLFEIYTIPEGLPRDNLKVRTANKKTFVWEVTPITGEHVQRSEFLYE